MKIVLKASLVLAAIILPFFVFSFPGEGPMRSPRGTHAKLGLGSWVSVASADVLGQNQIFNTSEIFDKFARRTISSTLRHIGENAYFYTDDEYWDTLSFADKNDILAGIERLSSEFDANIYPKETSFWGQEPRPGVDGDNRMVILLEQLKSGHGGYFSTSNGYPKNIDPESNAREMIVLNIEAADGPYVKMFLAHEFQHLISFNQKELMRDAEEDVWMNELRSEYSVTLAGYNDSFFNSNLERRSETFFDNPSDSLVEWPNVGLDYALVALFGEYIAGGYGENLLKDTLRASLTGISSIDKALADYGNSDRFIDVFGNWLAASYINNDLLNPKFGYSKAELGGLKAMPQRVTMISELGSLLFDYYVKPWQAYGHKILAASLTADKAVKLSPALNSKFAYADNLGRFNIFDKNFYVTNPGGLEYFFIFPINDKKRSGFGAKEDVSLLSLTAVFEEKTLGVEFGSILKDGTLIKKARESEVYVIEGKYKRYLRPEIIALYGHLKGVQPIEVDETTFHSYGTSNYVKYVDREEVYAVWPDGTKHWLNITPQQWDASGRDWNAIFIINDLELNAYKIGADIVR